MVVMGALAREYAHGYTYPIIYSIFIFYLNKEGSARARRRKETVLSEKWQKITP